MAERDEDTVGDGPGEAEGPTVDISAGTGTADETTDLEGRAPAGAFPPPIDDLLPTTAQRRSPVGAPPPGEPAPSITIDSAASALALSDVLRSRLLGKIGVTLALVVAATVPMLGGSRAGQLLVFGAAAVVLVTNAWLIYITGDPVRYRTWAIGIIWYSSSVAVGAGVIYFGVYSAAPLVAGLGVFVVAIGGGLALGLGVYLSVAAILGAVGLLAATGVIRDPGLITASHLPAAHQVVLLGLIEALLFAIFLLGRHSRRVTQQSMNELERALLSLSQKNALLDEARQDLSRALQIGGAGPWSGRRAGDWTVGALIGRGAMGEVYEASREGGDRAAIKLLTPAGAADARLVERFRREVEITRRLRSEHVVRVLDVSRPGDSIPYLVMELLDGADLASLLRRSPTMNASDVAMLAAEVGAGLEEAAGAGIVHRDIKPQNLFRALTDAGPRWKILDFGVSKLTVSTGTLTQGHVVGTPNYMAPEQAQAADHIDHRADSYALAAITYRCLTGRPPFRGKEAPAVLYNVVYSMPLRPTSLVALPGDVDCVLALGMAKAPEDRLDSAAGFAAALAAALEGQLAPPLRLRGRRLMQRSPWREP